MNSSQVPANFNIPFANNAGGSYIRTIPQAHSATPGAASLYDGFPPECFLAPGAGGIPPFGQDFNGLLNWVTSWTRWQQAGGFPGYNSTFSAAIGGYPLGAMLKNAAGNGMWVSTTENNVTDPDTGGAGWNQIIAPTTFPWASVTGAPTFVLASAWTGSNQSLASSGYQKLPGGLILQWGSFTGGGGSPVTVTLPIAYPTAQFTTEVSSPDSSTVAAVTSPTASNFVVTTANSGTGYYFSLGH